MTYPTSAQIQHAIQSELICSAQFGPKYTELRPVGLEVVWHFCPWMRARVNRKQFTLLRASTDRSAKQPLGQRDAIWCSFISLANHVAKMCMLQNLMAGEIEVEGNSSQLSVRHGSP